MKKVNLIGWAFMIILLAFVGCREDNIIDDSDTTNSGPVIKVNASVSGIVTDETGTAIADAKVWLDGETISTNEYGIFTFNNKVIPQDGALLKVTKAGYYDGSKVFNNSINATSYMNVHLMQKSITGQISGEAGGTVTTSDGASVTFEAGEIMDSKGEVYTGSVNVSSRWLNPKADNLASIMPGDLRAYDTDEDRVQLATYGMMVVELSAPNGEKLNVTDGKQATITFPLPDELKSSAPSTIPLWSYDEETGYWNEESTATLVNGQYVGEVGHFSFWNCDVPNDYIQLSGYVKDPNGLPIVWSNVRIHSQNAGTGYGWTNSDGLYAGAVPSNEVLDMEILTICGEIIFEMQIGPFSADAQLDDIILDNNNYSITFSGNLTDCDGVAITNGTVLINTGSYPSFFQTEDDGTFNFTRILCEDLSGTLRGYDYDALLASDVIDFEVQSGDDSYDFGTIEVCEELDEYVNITTDAPYYYSFITYEASIQQGFYVNAYHPIDSTNLQFYAEVDPGQTGSFEMYEFYYGDAYEAFNLNCDFNSGTGECPMVNITLNEGVGGFVEGNIIGNLIEEGWGGGSNTRYTEIEFRVLVN